MKRQSFAPSFLLYAAALLVCGGLRIWLVLGHLDAQTGFYTYRGPLVSVGNALLCAVAVLLFVLYLFRRTGGDYPVLRPSRGLPLLFAAVGLSILLYTLEGFGVLPFQNPNPGIVPGPNTRIVCGTLGALAAVGALFCGIRGVFARRTQGGFMPLISGLWMLAMLVCRFNEYDTLTTIADNLLAVLFMVFASMFFVGHARTLNGFSRKNGRNYVVPTGLCASLCGFLLVIPNWVWLAVHRTLDMPALLLGSLESVFVLVASVYALVFVRSTCMSIAAV